jgi:outer membrane murein-binding lipoprotein Lpp
MKTKLKMSFLTAGTALILLTGCVSSRKYKASQADVAKLKGDSAQLQQQVTSLNSNVQDLQNKNTALQGQLDKSNSSYAEQQKNLDYYQNYFKQQQQMMSQVSDDVKNALTQAGISNADVEQTNNTVYVRLDEDELFKKNSTMVSPGGKKALDNLTQVIANKSNVNVFVASGDSAMANAGMAMNNEPAPEPKHIVHHHVHHAASSASTSGGSSAQSGSTASNTPSGTSPAHHKVHHHYNSENPSMVYNGPGHHNRAWALKQGRMVAVADHFLKGGVPKINVSLQQPPTDGSQLSNTIKVVFVPKMEDFNPQMNGSSAVR